MEEPKQPVTTNFIIATMKDWVEKKMVIAPSTWIEAAQKLNVLFGDESDKLYDMQQIVAKERVHLIENQEEKNISEVKMRIESFDMYRDMKKQEAKITQIEEFIRIAKIQARLRDNEMSH
jgi:predicted oxidoreductase (fatty acid repression mutant protein)